MIRFLIILVEKSKGISMLQIMYYLDIYMQSFIGRLCKTKLSFDSFDIVVVYILKINMYSLCKILECPT